MEDLKAQRRILSDAEYNSYDADAFPGSARWMKNKKALDALKAFDAAHPEIVAELTAAKKAARKASYDALSDFVKAGS